MSRYQNFLVFKKHFPLLQAYAIEIFVHIYTVIRTITLFEYITETIAATVCIIILNREINTLVSFNGHLTYSSKSLHNSK